MEIKSTWFRVNGKRNFYLQNNLPNLTGKIWQMQCDSRQCVQGCQMQSNQTAVKQCKHVENVKRLQLMNGRTNTHGWFGWKHIEHSQKPCIHRLHVYIHTYTRNGNHIRNKINEIDDGLRDVVAVLQVRRVCQLHKNWIIGPRVHYFYRCFTNQTENLFFVLLL